MAVCGQSDRSILLAALMSCLIINIWCLSSCTANASKLGFPNFINSGQRQRGTLSNKASNSGTIWAVLVAGSSEWRNYRHQANVCHAYQILKKAGLKDENIVVFMYDDIAFNVDNPKPGVIVNRPDGPDVYKGVPKDYTGNNATANNLYGVILGNKTSLTGGSGKVVDSGPDDYIFIYYTDHGGPGIVEMAAGDPIYAKDLVDVLKKKHASNSYKRMVFYLEACESGSMFDGLLPSNLNIYAVTSTNPKELGWAIYCPRDHGRSQEYDVCLGDLFSVSWMEDSDKEDLRKETLNQQYELVRRRTVEGDGLNRSSHVMQYGDMSFTEDFLSSYMGSNPTNLTSVDEVGAFTPLVSLVSQRDADLLHFWHKFNGASTGSREKLEAREELFAEISHRKQVDHNINRIGKLLLGSENIEKVLKNVRPPGQPIVDDWDCLKKLVRTYERYCGSLSTYGMKYMRDFANMCNVGVNDYQMVVATTHTCHP